MTSGEGSSRSAVDRFFDDERDVHDHLEVRRHAGGVHRPAGANDIEAGDLVDRDGCAGEDCPNGIFDGLWRRTGQSDDLGDLGHGRTVGDR